MRIRIKNFMLRFLSVILFGNIASEGEYFLLGVEKVKP